MALGDFLHIIDAQLAPVGDALAEEFVATVDIGVEITHLLLVEGAGYRTEGAVLVGLHFVEAHAQLVLEQSAKVGEHAEDADTAGEGGRLGNNPVAAATDVVAARGCHAAHRHHDGLLLLEHLHLVPDLLRGVGAAAAAVHAQHHGFHVVVVGEFLKVLAHYLRIDHVALAHGVAGAAIDDVAVGVIDGNLVTVVVVSLHAGHVGEAQLADVVIASDFQQFLHLVFHLVGIEHAIDHFLGNEGLGVVESDEIVGIDVERVDGNLTAGGDLLEYVLPNAVDIGGDLLAVGVAHVVGSEDFRGALIGAHLGELHLYAKLGHQVLQKVGLRGYAMPVQHAFGVDIHLVGHRCQIIGGLGITVAIGDNPLAAFLEFGEGAADGLQRGIGVGGEHAGLDVDALDVVVVLGFLDGTEHIVETY